MKHRTSRRTSAAGTAAKASWALVVALCFALAMLGHVTGARWDQWAEGAFTACLVGLAGSLFVGLAMTVFALQDAHDKQQVEAAVARLYRY